MALRIRQTKAELQEKNEALQAKMDRLLAEFKLMKGQLEEAQFQWSRLVTRDVKLTSLLNRLYHLKVTGIAYEKETVWSFVDVTTNVELTRNRDMADGYEQAIMMRMREKARG